MLVRVPQAIEVPVAFSKIENAAAVVVYALPVVLEENDVPVAQGAAVLVRVPQAIEVPVACSKIACAAAVVSALPPQIFPVPLGENDFPVA